jgi:putative ABC transport system ATP-binding protein
MVFHNRTQQYPVLKAVDLEVPAGSVQLLMGPAGAGKTTLLLITAGLLTPTAGQVELLGHAITQLSRQELTQFRLHNLGIVFQDNNLLRSLTALENVELAFTIKGIRGKAARQQAQELLEAVGLSKQINSLARQLSGGQQQRVGVARALAGNPPLIIADEPTSALDSATGQLVSQLLQRHAREQGCTVLIATHDHRLIPYADRLAYLEDGTIRSTQPIDAPFGSLQHAELLSLF